MIKVPTFLLFTGIAAAPLFAAETAVSLTEQAASFSVENDRNGFMLSPGLKVSDFNASVAAYVALPPERVRAHHDAARFPGAVAANAGRVTRRVDFSTGVCRWQSTGLYAAPGEIVNITLDSPLPAGVTVRVHVGCHTDRLRLKEGSSLKRFPIIAREFTLKPGVNAVANAFGGGLFIEVRGTVATEPPPYAWEASGYRKPELADAPATPFTLTIANAVVAPLFRLGTDKASDWDRIRSSPAPWGELAGERVILHVPTALMAEMKDPEALLKWWDRVLAAEDELVGRRMPWKDRMVPDVQISAGWMHAGYPFMYHLVSAKNSVDLEKLSSVGDWGFFHELGHNRQSHDWTFSGQGEVTVNFFSLYCMETIVGLPRGFGHGSMKNLGKLLDARLAEKPDMGYFTQLAPFVALMRQYDWAPLKATIASFQTAPNPGTFTEKQRQAEFVARYSCFAKADLSDFFSKLGYDVTGVAERVKDLPKFDYAAFRATLDEKAAATVTP